MNTINNMASTAAKAVWGENENNKEPASGKQGDTSKGEPYDAGNMDNPPETPSEAGPTATKGSSAGKGDSTKGQNDTRDPSDPDTDPKTAEPKENVDDSGEGTNDVKIDGPGPKPLDEVAKGRGGGEAASEEKKEGDDDDDDDDGPQKESKGEGTGEKYIKSSGLKADGGDFDATKPGAGREADRLMDQKGMDHTPGDIPGDIKPENERESSGGDSPATKEKKSLGTRIKEKLHKH